MMATRTPANGASELQHANAHDRAKVSIFQVFRSSFEEHDARRRNFSDPNDEVAITRRSRPRREGVTADQLRAHLAIDLDALLNTIRLDAVCDLSDAPHVAGSVVNYGFRDLSSVSLTQLQRQDLISSIQKSLLRHEPRIVPETLHVSVLEAEADSHRRIKIAVEAEIAGDPVDVPVDFDAEVDFGAGKMRMSTLRVNA
ncbi:type VI secretion system baseplate subunit TssE [Tritonibacter scottomollicae]